MVVVAFFLGNDLDNNVAATQYRLHKPVFLDSQLTLGNVPVPRPGQSVDPKVLRQLVDLDRVELTVQILAAMQDACQQAGCPLIVMKFGTFLAPELPYARRLSARFKAGALALDPPLTLLDLDEEFGLRSQTLKRLTEGTYGVCEMSGKKISKARLEAIPFARLTVECQAQLERERRNGYQRHSVRSLFGLGDDEGSEMTRADALEEDRK